ncbi:hypothetical protein [Nostoc cycadae]|uniref:Transposase n=1 Tax=Nostoc cycadae WK-1 TaxID=1861711 RepID=A0A2H6LND0_9NOSO|nr:hypothetical protein [Nostoc cycadae]GBE94730.1 transposase [Nostoc cycadae WK-1]
MLESVIYEEIWQEWYQEGFELGFKQSLEQKAQEIAISMLSKGMAIALIIHCTGLTIEQVQKL